MTPLPPAGVLMLALAAGIPGDSDAGSSNNPLIPLEVLFGDNAATSPRLSSDGALVAYRAHSGLDGVLAIAPLSSLHEPALSIPDPRNCISHFWWSGRPTHLLVQIRPRCTLSNTLGQAPGYTVATVEVANGTVTRVSRPSRFRYRLHLGSLARGKIALTRDKRDPNATGFEVIDLLDGNHETRESPPGATRIFFDQRLRPRLAMRRTRDGGFDLIADAGLPDRGAGNWRSVGHYGNAERYAFRFLGISDDGRHALLIDTRNRDAAGVVSLDLHNGARRVAFEHERWEVIDALFDSSRNKLLAVQTQGRRKHWTAIDISVSRDFEFLAARFQGDVSIASQSADGRYWALAVDRDVSPRRHFIYERRSQVLYPVSAEENVSTAGEFAPMQPIRLTARDGTLLTGYLTQPIGATDGAGPMVQLVHGGPAGRHSWGFEPMTQWLANRGYAVLALNYRGSAGLGAAFQRQGFAQWGGKMQQDLADAAHWAIDTGVADPARIAIMGHSYGGYAALMGLVQEPGLYACAIGLSGLTDLEFFITSLESFRSQVRTEIQRNFLESQIARYREELGTGSVDLKSVSPIYAANRITKPVLLVHGQRDRGIPAVHSERLFERLKRRHHPAALLRFAKEGHTIRQPRNIRTMAMVSERFLASCLGGRFEDRAIEAVAISGTSLIATNNFPGPRRLGDLSD